jgi:uncharacterized protein (TIGR03067 family)
MRMLMLAALAVGLTLAADAPARAQDKLDGTWVVVSAERGGKPHDAIKDDKVIFAGNKMTIKGKGKDQKLTIKVDASKKPKTVDFSPEDMADKTAKGIYVLEGDELKVCMAPPDQERPKEFATKEGSQLMLVKLKREKP